jgi:hypothetical protein
VADVGHVLQESPHHAKDIPIPHNTTCHGDITMPKARSAGQCAQCEADDRVRMTFMTCSRCRRYFCSEHGTSQLDQCEACIEGGEETE